MYYKRVLVFVLLFSAIAMSQVYAQESEIEAGITPDSPLWGLDRAFERINLAFTRDDVRRSEKELIFAEERLSESLAMIEIEDIISAERAEQERTKLVERIKSKIDVKSDGTTERELELERELEVQEVDAEKVKLYVKIKTEGIDLTEDQLLKLEAFIGSLGGVRKMDLDIKRDDGSKIEIEMSLKDDEESDDDSEDEKDDDTDETDDDEDENEDDDTDEDNSS